MNDQFNLIDDSTFKQPNLTGQESQEAITVSSFKRKKRKGLKELLLKDLPEVPVHYELKDTAYLCADCGHTLHDIGATIVREEPLFIPARIEKNHLSTCI